MLRVNWMAGFVALIGGVVLATQMQNCSGTRVKNLRFPTSLQSVNEVLHFSSDHLLLENKVEKHQITGKCVNKLDSKMKWSWSFVKDSGELISSGDGKCIEGQFQAELTELDGLECEKSHWFKASVSSSSALFETQIQISKDCPAKHRRLAIASEDRSCFFELREFNSGSQCVFTCYSRGVSDEVRIIELEKCKAPQSEKPASAS